MPIIKSAGVLHLVSELKDTEWRSKPALVFVGEYIDLVEQVVSEGERKFS